MKKLETINSAWRIETADKRKGHTYQSGRAGPTVVGATNETGVFGEEGVVVVPSCPFCKACGNYGHQRQTKAFCVHKMHIANTTKVRTLIDYEE